MNEVFVDTVGLLATWDTSDQWHKAARSAFQQLTAQRRSIITTTFVLLECGNAAARRPYRDAVARFREQMQVTGRIITPTEEQWRIAWDEYARAGTHGRGIVDQVSFVVMRDLKLRDAFTNDRHFQSAGFNTLF